jgi:hypothetical protein
MPTNLRHGDLPIDPKKSRPRQAWPVFESHKESALGSVTPFAAALKVSLSRAAGIE